MTSNPDHVDVDASDVDWDPPRVGFVPTEVMADPDPADVQDADQDADA